MNPKMHEERIASLAGSNLLITFCRFRHDTPRFQSSKTVSRFGLTMSTFHGHRPEIFRIHENCPQRTNGTACPLHAHDQDGEAGDEHHHGGECGEITKKIGHVIAPFLYMFLICSIFVHSSSRKT
ncbi:MULTISPECIES: hypothetical protein [unclassified Rhizobium]|uniref:hypothetical protein n=1 Tax=unclassified Rhizobium TaxID=2613769 RepID=UPI00138F036C|nr:MULTISPECIES: hypothetical protein [unclassified Rhizobium]